ncbi:MAG: hypothetical protein K2X94_04145 [Amoebophilaceae bacterium]|nr:hypothetical protein [Amoebophilaceae bacterium]
MYKADNIAAIDAGAEKNVLYLLDKIDTSSENLNKIITVCLANDQSELLKKMGLAQG